MAWWYSRTLASALKMAGQWVETQCKVEGWVIGLLGSLLGEIEEPVSF